MISKLRLCCFVEVMIGEMIQDLGCCFQVWDLRVVFGD